MGPLGDPATAALRDEIDDEGDMGKAGDRVWRFAVGLVAASILRNAHPAAWLFARARDRRLHRSSSIRCLTPREFAPEP
jgi:hypothetical protein